MHLLSSRGQALGPHVARPAAPDAVCAAAQVSDAQDYNALKVRLESDRQGLEQHMEAMLATYQLNIEKLDYNYRVLVERDHENTATINQQKRKIARQRDLLMNLKTRCAAAARSAGAQNFCKAG
jgi:dynein regulatry complex protein 1